MWKKLKYLVIIICLGASQLGSAQNTHYVGAEVGIGLSKEILLINSNLYEGLKFRPSYSIGASWEIRTNKSFSLVSHLFFINQGSAVNTYLLDDKGNNIGQTKRANHNNIQFSVGANAFLGSKHMTYIGGSINLINNISYDYLLTNGSKKDNTAYLRSMNYGISLRVGHNKNIKGGIIGTEFRGAIGLQSIYEPNPFNPTTLVPYSVNLVLKYQRGLKLKKVQKEKKKDKIN